MKACDVITTNAFFVALRGLLDQRVLTFTPFCQMKPVVVTRYGDDVSNYFSNLSVTRPHPPVSSSRVHNINFRCTNGKCNDRIFFGTGYCHLAENSTKYDQR